MSITPTEPQLLPPVDARRSRLARSDAPALVWIGMGVAAAGFALILLSWALLAGEDSLQDQLPPLVGVGLLGLAVVLAGLALVVAAVLRRDAAQRQRQLDQLSAAVAALEATEARPEPSRRKKAQ